MNPEATKEQFTNDSWYKTGDVEFFHGDKLYLLDRKRMQGFSTRKTIKFNKLRISSKRRTIFRLQTSSLTPTPLHF